MEGTTFFVIGAILVLAALLLAGLGIRGPGSFPPGRRVLIGLTALFALLVIATTALAVVNAREEQDEREEELAAEAAEEASGEQPAAEAPAGTPGEATVLDVTSPDDGALTFEPDGLEAPAGTITLAYDNPSPVAHSIAIESGGQTIAESDIVTGESTEVSAELAPGEYVFYCTVPGHREGGMLGDLTVQ